MSRYSKQDDLSELVRIAIRSQFSYKEAVSWINKQGHKISERKFGRMKQAIEKNRRNLMQKLHGDKQLEFNAKAVETLESMKNEMEEIASNKNLTTWERIKATEVVAKILKDMAQFYDAVPVIHRLAQRAQTTTENDNNEDIDVSVEEEMPGGEMSENSASSEAKNKDDSKPALKNSKNNFGVSGETGNPSMEKDPNAMEKHPEDPPA